RPPFFDASSKERSMRRFDLILILALSGLIGCQPGSQSSPESTEKKGNEQTGTAQKDNLALGDGQALQNMTAGHKGQVVLVDYWATWCLPCVEGFPHAVELANKYREAGLATIAVSFDQLEEEPRVREFLAQKGADFENLLSSYGGVSQRAAVD